MGKHHWIWLLRKATLTLSHCEFNLIVLFINYSRLRLHDMKDEFNDDQNSTMDETVESFIGDLAAKQQGNISRKCSNHNGD